VPRYRLTYRADSRLEAIYRYTFENFGAAQADSYFTALKAQLAGKAGTAAVYISQIERGDRRVGRKLRAKIGAALKVDAALLERHED
jgi:plasmid stabilization system protein ParE